MNQIDGVVDQLPEPPFVAGQSGSDGQPAPHRPRHGGSVLMAAMLGLADALGMAPEQKTELAQPASPSDDDVNLDYGGLRSLEE
jgi:hypothetical protein